MPAKKTNKAVAKRCHITANGKIMATQAGRRHLLRHKSRKQKRNMRGTAPIGCTKQQKTLKSMMTA